ncbi:hypothetical protein A9Q98_13180 [Thalassotalea sp. 42_200_T64]|nr:hypothetical protein A9Q98_13180 [Thalassotalea sp. 42_200_T64]
MLKIYSDESFVQVHHIKNLLESHNIDCTTRNEGLSSLAGEVPSTECWPELWLIDDRKEQAAMAIIAESKLDRSAQKSDWVCAKCDEKIEAEFEICWQCGSLR